MASQKISETDAQSFDAAVRPAIKWLCENAHPHHTIIITPTGAELLEGKACTEVLDYVKG